MFTLDVSRKAMLMENIPFGPQGFTIIESNDKGAFIIQHRVRGCFWMAVPTRDGGNKLYPMKAI